MNEKEYLTNRVESQKQYFSKTSRENKKKYIGISTAKLLISIVITVISPIVCSVSISSIVISILAAIITFLDGVALLKKYNENWINYRLTNEQIKREEILFKTKSEKYYDQTDKNGFNIFVQNIEDIIQNTNQKWEKTNSKKGEQ